MLKSWAQVTETLCWEKDLEDGSMVAHFEFYEKITANPMVIFPQLIYRKYRNGQKIDELIQKNVQFNFDYRDELEVEWAGHPNWFFRLSKFSLPFLEHPSVPRSWFLNQLEIYPKDLENFVLKPLFSFAGSGVKINVTAADLDAITEIERCNYLLQEKISYDPVIQTPDDPAKVEIRVMFVWPDEDAVPMTTMLLVRMSKGTMMGVDFNKNKMWVGASAGFLAE